MNNGEFAKGDFANGDLLVDQPARIATYRSRCNPCIEAVACEVRMETLRKAPRCSV